MNTTRTRKRRQCKTERTIMQAFRVDADTARKAWDLMTRRVAPPHPNDEPGEDFPQTRAWVRQCFNVPGKHDRRMAALDELLETSGVEPLGPVHMHDGPPYEYLNAGDTYALTVVWSRATGRIFLACYGDIVEKEDRNGEW